MRRRDLLRAAGGLTAGTALAGCTGRSDAVQVAVLWSAAELSEFRRVLDGYPGAVEVVSAGDDIDAFIRARHRAGTSPDVAIVSQPGLVTDYARQGWLAPLDQSLANAFAKPWSELLWLDGTLYGVWVKAAHKSLFWYLPSIVDTSPDTWDDLVALVASLRHPAPLALGAADGWVLTDWFENVLAAVAPAGFYDALATGRADWRDTPVRDALNRLAQLWSIPGAFPGGGRRALLTQFDESVIQVTRRQAAMVFEADFTQAVVDDFAEPGGPTVDTFRFPAIAGTRPLIVGGDAAVVMRGSRTGARLVEWLSRPDAFRPWIADGGYLSPNSSVRPEQYPSGRGRQLAAELTATPASFDLSDQLTGAFGGTDGVGMWRILQDFFQAVTGPRPTGAVDDTTRALARAARAPGGGR